MTRPLHRIVDLLIMREKLDGEGHGTVELLLRAERLVYIPPKPRLKRDRSASRHIHGEGRFRLITYLEQRRA